MFVITPVVGEPLWRGHEEHISEHLRPVFECIARHAEKLAVDLPEIRPKSAGPYRAISQYGTYQEDEIEQVEFVVSPWAAGRSIPVRRNCSGSGDSPL